MIAKATRVRSFSFIDAQWVSWQDGGRILHRFGDGQCTNLLGIAALVGSMKMMVKPFTFDAMVKAVREQMGR